LKKIPSKFQVNQIKIIEAMMHDLKNIILEQTPVRNKKSKRYWNDIECDIEIQFEIQTGSDSKNFQNHHEFNRDCETWKNLHHFQKYTHNINPAKNDISNRNWNNIILLIATSNRYRFDIVLIIFRWEFFNSSK
jgi:hypothetical protein